MGHPIYGEAKHDPRRLLLTSRFPNSFEQGQFCGTFYLFLSEREEFEAGQPRVSSLPPVSHKREYRLTELLNLQIQDRKGFVNYLILVFRV